MKERRMRALSESFRESLVNDTMRFWINHAVDREFGGFTNFLDRQGALLCTDKPLWVQGRFSWTMAHLYNTLEKREEWLALARHGIDFITRHGFDTDGRVFYSVTREGRPLRKRRYLIAEIFCHTGLRRICARRA